MSEAPELKGQIAEAVTAVILNVQSTSNYSHILANGTVYGKVLYSQSMERELAVMKKITENIYIKQKINHS